MNVDLDPIPFTLQGNKEHAVVIIIVVLRHSDRMCWMIDADTCTKLRQ